MADTDSGMTAIVAIIAIVIILGVGFLIFRNMAGTGGSTNSGPSINVDLPTGGGNQ